MRDAGAERTARLSHVSVMTLTTPGMMRPLFLTMTVAAAAFQLAACGDDRLDEAAVAHARDSSLASDLRLARGDTSRSAVADGALRNTSAPPMVETRDAAVPNGSSARVVSNNAAGTMMESAGSIGTPLSDSSASAPGDGFVGPSCASPALLDQRRCLTSYLARSDVALDRNYQSLIVALKREAGKQPGDREPATVLRLRTAQRNWLVYRDDECRRRNEGTEGPLWAPTRAKCLAEYSDQRSQELANALSGRASKASAVTPAATKSVSKRSTAKRTKSAKRARRRRR